MDFDKILENVKEILEIKKNFEENNKTGLEDYLDKKFSDLKKDKLPIYNMCLNGTMDFSRLEYMINMAKNVKNNTISKHNAAVEVGQRLVDEFVKPKLDSKDK